jgi:hypothetical protein
MRLESTLKKSSPIYLGPKNLDTILMHWMSVKLADNFQIRKHSWPCLFHYNRTLVPYEISKVNFCAETNFSCQYVRDLVSPLRFMLRRSSLVECVSVLHGTCLHEVKLCLISNLHLITYNT